ncbi:hypothetical protein GO308_12740 [Sphingomonas sp. SFZ2018-12]|uniref:hypothetical protein n=1 Tax=Sphingomonas sp. SFZ2018-12 TaxID=2683197 RepID=UPI001F0DC3D4|nr:hypothetical protein [Sphingomonas sp. SFZ2018-12]MCH4893982.1 hypothetical protein [Sphingomonas sp. SFZ2018-12]
MSADSRIAQDVADRQVAMFAMFVGPGLFTTRAALSVASGIPESTLKSWAGGAAMPFHAVLALRRFLPAEAINMMSEPGGFRLVPFEAIETNWDAIAADSAGLVGEVCEARRDGKIDHIEDARLKRRARHLAAVLSEIGEAG